MKAKEYALSPTFFRGSSFRTQDLKTKIKSIQGEHYPEAVIQQTNSEYQATIRTNVLLGYMNYVIKENELYINYMEKTSNNYTHIGSALHELALRESYRHGKGGHVSILANPTSIIFHYLQGFRAEKKYEFMMGDGVSANTKRLCMEYLETHDQEIYNSLKSKDRYLEAKERAAVRLSKPEDELTFDEVMTNGVFIYDYTNKELQKLIDNADTKKKIDTSNFPIITMSLPEETILSKLKLFEIESEQQSPVFQS